MDLLKTFPVLDFSGESWLSLAFFNVSGHSKCSSLPNYASTLKRTSNVVPSVFSKSSFYTASTEQYRREEERVNRGDTG